DVELILNQSVDSKAHGSGAEANKSRPHLKKPVLVAQETVAEPVQDEASQFDTTDSADRHHNDTTQLADASAVRKKISIEFLRYFYYPDAALRRNWQGDVILQFTLLPDGHLDHIRIHQSSGYKALDDAAIHALQQVEPQQELALLADAALLHTLPVSYRLTNPL
ncbi:MAG: energy transducer TonB, partial [Gammaproteobacteria bacterium]|nr:energy transducer TonB [Gammaproteobacteria bacterium]